MKVFDNDDVLKSISKYNLSKQYNKACNYIEIGNYKAVLLKLREPKSAQVYQFRINRKFRAFAIRELDSLYVYKISDHQD